MARVGEQIALFCERRGWSQSQLANKAHVSRSHLNRVERGLANPTTAFLEKIEETLGVAPGTLSTQGEIIHLEDTLNVLPEDVRKYILSKDGQLIIKMLADAQITPETIEHIIKGIRAAVEATRTM